MMLFMETLKKLFVPHYTDNIVQVLTDDTLKEFHETAIVAKSHRDLLRKNGVTLQITVAAGADKHHD